MFAALYAPATETDGALLAAAREFSPRVERQLGGRLVLIDTAGLGRIVGDADAIRDELRKRAGDAVTVTVAPTRTAALLLAAHGTSACVEAGRAAAAVGALPLGVFEKLAKKGSGAFLPASAQKGSRPLFPCGLCRLCLASHRQARMACGQPGGACTELATLRRWGVRSLADLAALPAADLAARLGQVGVALQRLARGADAQPLVPIVEPARFEASFDLEWPVEMLQPLSFVLTRLLDPLGAALERADRGAAAIVTELTLVTRSGEASRARDVHVRRLELPAPMRDARVLRTLILLDLESHPPPAAIDRVAVRLEPTPGRIVQFSLLERAGPQPETIATLVSRLTALMGEGRVGSPALVDSHAPDAFALGGLQTDARDQPPEARHLAADPSPPASVLRRFRLPVAARVRVERGRPVRVMTDRIGIRGGDVRQSAGPWRSAGGWWSRGAAGGAEAQRGAWDRDEYDVALADGAAYRVYRDRHQDRWYVEGILD